MPSIILDWCKIPMNPWYKQIWRRGEVISVYINGAVADGDGNIYDSVTEDMEATYAAYEMMNYDILFGNRYSKKYLYTKPSDEQKTAEP